MVQWKSWNHFWRRSGLPITFAEKPYNQALFEWKVKHYCFKNPLDLFVTKTNVNYPDYATTDIILCSLYIKCSSLTGSLPTNVIWELFWALQQGTFLFTYPGPKIKKKKQDSYWEVSCFSEINSWSTESTWLVHIICWFSLGNEWLIYQSQTDLKLPFSKFVYYLGPLNLSWSYNPDQKDRNLNQNHVVVNISILLL